MARKTGYSKLFISAFCHFFENATQRVRVFNAEILIKKIADENFLSWKINAFFRA